MRYTRLYLHESASIELGTDRKVSSEAPSPAHVFVCASVTVDRTWLLFPEERERERGLERERESKGERATWEKREGWDEGLLGAR